MCKSEIRLSDSLTGKQQLVNVLPTFRLTYLLALRYYRTYTLAER